MKVESATIREALIEGTDFLTEKDIETARLDAEVLLAHIIGKSRMELYKDYYRELTKEELNAYDEILQRRGTFEPVAYLRGKKEFFSIEFKVNKNVMIPRPETELLVQTALDHLEDYKETESVSILDVGTGSGAIALALLANLNRSSFIYASDLSFEALQIAKCNALTNPLYNRICFISCDLFYPFKGKFDLILSNPPYVKSDEVCALERGGKLFEPRVALDGGESGLELIGLLLRDGINFLKDDGLMLIEVGAGQSNDIKTKSFSNQYREMKFLLDHSGMERLLFLKK